MEMFQMKHALFKECLDTLILVRALKHNELDPGVIAELDAVITKMTLLLETTGQSVVVDRVLTERILTTTGRVAVCLDWVRRISQQFLE